MSNLGELIFERAWEEGWEKGWKQGWEEGWKQGREQAWRAGWEKGREETRILILQMFLENGGTEEEAERIFEAAPEELEKAGLQMVQPVQLAGRMAVSCPES